MREWERWSSAFSAKNSSSVVGGLLHGDALARQGKWDEALGVLNKPLGNDPQHVLCLNLIGVVHAMRGDVGQAAANFDDAVLKMKDRKPIADVYANIGALKILKKDGAKSAIAAFTEAMKISPGFALALHGRGCLQLIFNKIKEAEEDLRQAEANAPCAGGLFSENLLSIAAYLGGQTKDELYAMLTNPGTTFDASVTQISAAWEAYKKNPNQWNYNRFAEQFGRLGATEQKGFFNNTVKADLSKNSSLRSSYETNLNSYHSWNVKGHAIFWTNMVQRTLTFIASFTGIPIAKAGAATVAVEMESPKRWTTHNADSAKQQVSFYENSFKKSVGGVDSRLRFDDGQWPFNGNFGFVYSRGF
jgi:hypothetical protein